MDRNPTLNPGSLSEAWAAWCRFLDSLNLGGEGTTDFAPVRGRLLTLSQEHQADDEHVKAVVYGLYRGVPLLLAALGWEEPRAGRRSEQPSPTDAMRGEQWRLVMGYGGFETLVKALLGHQERGGLGPKHFAALESRCDLPPYLPLEAPAHTETLRGEWFRVGPDGKGDVLLRFLGVEGSDASAINAWLVQRQALTSWAAAMSLAKALRNATAHGALSASKVREWKLQTTARVLLDNLGQVAAAAFARLTAIV